MAKHLNTRSLPCTQGQTKLWNGKCSDHWKQRDVRTDRDKATFASYFKLRCSGTGETGSVFMKVKSLKMNGEAVSKRNSKCPHLDRGRLFRLIAVISDVIFVHCKQGKTKNKETIPFTWGLKLIIFISGLILDFEDIGNCHLPLMIALELLHLIVADILRICKTSISKFFPLFYLQTIYPIISTMHCV